jgi:hypothetical protein
VEAAGIAEEGRERSMENTLTEEREIDIQLMELIGA